MSTLRRETVEHVVRAAALAPELPGVLPPALVWSDDVLEVRAQRSPDPAEDRGRCLAAGGTLQHILVAAHGLGLDAACEAFPEPSDPASIARVRLAPGRPASPRDLELAAAVVDRYAGLPSASVVPLSEDVLAVVRLAVEGEGAELVRLTSPTDDGLAVDAAVVTRDDGPVAWVVAGCALGALLLKASQYGVQVTVDARPALPAADVGGRAQLALRLVQLRLRTPAPRRDTSSFPQKVPAAAGR